MDLFKKTAVKSQAVVTASVASAPTIKSSPIRVKSGVSAGVCRDRPRH